MMKELCQMNLQLAQLLSRYTCPDLMLRRIRNVPSAANKKTASTVNSQLFS